MKKLLLVLMVFTMVVLLVKIVLAQDVVRIGCAVSLTGKLAYEGNACKYGNDFWALMANRKGGLNIGGKKYKVEIKYYDDESDVLRATKLVEKLITEDKIDFIMGPYGSGPNFAVSAITEKYRKLLIAFGASPQIYERGFKYIFSCLLPLNLYMKEVIHFSSQQSPKPKTVALLWKNDLSNKSVADPTPGYCRENGLEVIYNEKFAPEASDFSTELSVIKAKNPDIFIFLSQAEQFILAVKQMKDIKMNPKMIAGGLSVAEPYLVKTLGKDAEYLTGPVTWDKALKLKDDLFRDPKYYAEEFKKTYGFEPGYHNSDNSVSCEVLGVAMEKAGSLDVEKVRNALVAMDINTMIGRVKFSETGQVVGREAPVGQILNGKFTVVYPFESAEAKMIWPKPAWQ